MKELNIKAMRYYVSTEEASFFNNNKMEYANTIPTTGNYNIGDFIISSTQEDGIFGWVCTVAGNPGEWEVIGSGANTGSGLSDKMVVYYNVVEFTDARSEIEIGIDGFVVGEDLLEVHYNGLLLAEGVDFNISDNGMKIEAINEIWNENADDTQAMIFRVLKTEGVTLKEYKNNIVLNEDCYEVEIGIDEFEVKKDLIEIHINGSLILQGIDYEIVDNVISKIDRDESWKSEQIMCIRVIKNISNLIEPNDGSVTMDKLADDVKEAIEEASNIDISGKQDVTDEELITNDKTIVGAINELFQDVDSGKNIIADAIDEEGITGDSTFAAMGEAIEAKNEEISELNTTLVEGKTVIADAIGNEYITVDSTFSAMSEAIIGLHKETSSDSEDSREVLYNMMIEDGYDEATSDMTVDELIELLDESNIEISEIKQIACGEYHTFILKNDGSVYSCGLNEDGQLGLGDTDDRTTFTQVNDNINNDVAQIACGYNHTFILKNDGSVYSCGYNGWGQLGLGSTTDRTSFKQVTTNINNDVSQISCGDYYTFILKNDGSVYSCGFNSNGQLGLGISDTNAHSTFTQVTTNINNDVKQIACGFYHTFILKNDGSVYSCGGNHYGQLGLGDTTNRTSFTQVTTNINNDVEQIACGYNHTFILKNDGSVYSCGANNYGQLGLGISDTDAHSTFTQVITNINNDVKQIVCAYWHTFILKNDVSVYSCGLNSSGQLGLGTSGTKQTTFTQVTTNINNDVKQISGGHSHTFIIKNDGSVYSCGANGYGQLGLGDTTNQTTITNVPLSTSITEYEISRLKLYYYLLDNDIEVTEDMDIGTMLDTLINYNINNKLNGYITNLKIVLIDEGVEVTDEDDMDSLITKTDEEFAAREAEVEELEAENTTLNNTITSKDTEISNLNSEIDELEDDAESTRSTLADLMLEGGYDINGDEDIDSLLELLTISGISVSDIKQIACGDYHTFILKNDGSVWACGYNGYGQLGLGTYISTITTFTQVTTNMNNDVEQIVCGGNHTFILKNDGSVYSCGNNEYGQLGLGDTTDRNTFTQVTTNINNDVKQIACGDGHTFILKNDGSVYSCGYNNYGQLGLGSTTNTYTSFTQVTTNINNDVKQIACGYQFTFILKNNGSVWACGYNGYGQLGLGTSDDDVHSTFTQVTTNINNDVKQIACGWGHTFILKNDGSVYSCGYNSDGQLGLSSTSTKTTFTQVTTNINNDVKQIACGLYHTFILKNDGSVYSCGYNSYGQLGLGTTDTNAHSTFTQVTSTLNDFKQIACGSVHTFILKNDGSVYSCGKNQYGQLGLGASDTNAHSTFTQVTTNIKEF